MKNNWLLFLVISLLIGGVISLAASPSPDGLEYIAEEHSFLDNATSWIAGLIPDYAVPGIANEYLATAIAGIIGTLVTFGLLYGLGIALFKSPVSLDKSEKN